MCCCQSLVLLVVLHWEAAPRSGVAPTHPSRTPRTTRERVLPGPTPCSKTTPSSASACARLARGNTAPRADRGNVNLLNAFSEAFKQRRDYLAMQVEVRVPFELRARSVFFRSQTVSCCVGLQDTLADKSVTMSDELRQALQQFPGDAQGRTSPDCVVKLDCQTFPRIGQGKPDYSCRHEEQMHDLLLPKGRSASSVLLEQNGWLWRRA